jgi:metal-responsive CopG/Arc/MetJ family transcriptional regulator
MKKFKIPEIPTARNKTIRFPEELIKEIEKLIKDTNCSFSAFVIEAVRVAVENLKEGGDDNEEKN